MKPISTQRRDKAVYEILLADIKNGVWKAGDKMPSESELCNMLGVSRITIRAAIQQLKGVGLLETKQGKGTFVTAPSDIYDMSDFNQILNLTEKEFNEINALREILEKKAVELIMEQETPDLEAVGAAYYGMKRALENHDYEEYSKHDYLFHMSIIIAANNDVFTRIINIFKNEYYKYFKELNKFMFDNAKDAAALYQNVAGDSSLHTKLYRYLTHQIILQPSELVDAFSEGNRARFCAYLRKREEEKL